MLAFLAGLLCGVLLVLIALLALFFRMGSFTPPTIALRKTPAQMRMLADKLARQLALQQDASSKRLAQQPQQQQHLDGAPLDVEHPDPTLDASDLLAFGSDIPLYLRHYRDNQDVESCVWLDILCYRMFRSFQHASASVDFEAFANAKLARLDVPEFVGSVVVQDINFGSVVPVAREIKVVSWRDRQPVVVEFNLAYQGDAHLSLETELRLNVKGKKLATLPIELALSDLEFDAMVRVEVEPAVHSPSVSMQLISEPYLDFQVHSEIGAKVTLKDLPHLRNILLTGIARLLAHEIVAPHKVFLNFEGLNLDIFQVVSAEQTLSSHQKHRHKHRHKRRGDADASSARRGRRRDESPDAGDLYESDSASSDGVFRDEFDDDRAHSSGSSDFTSSEEERDDDRHGRRKTLRRRRSVGAMVAAAARKASNTPARKSKKTS